MVAGIAGYARAQYYKRKIERGEIDSMPSITTVQDMECCGQHETCEKDSLLAAISKQIEYYDDEELDRFRGKTSDEYTEEECEEFREILYSMKSEEVAGWIRSLQLRGVELPTDLKDEVILIVGERRTGQAS
jgi:hypothetical protein